MAGFNGRSLEKTYRAFEERADYVKRVSGIKTEWIEIGRYEDNDKAYPFRVLVLGDSERGYQNRKTVGFFVAGIHGDEPQGVDALEEVVSSLGIYQSILKHFEPIYVFPVVSGGAYEKGSRYRGDGINNNRKFWIDCDNKPEEVLLAEGFVRERWNPLLNYIFLTYQADDRHCDSIYSLVNSNPKSGEFALSGLQAVESSGIRIYKGDITEYIDEDPNKEQVRLINNGGVLTKVCGIYKGAWGAPPEAKASSNKPVDIDLELNLRNSMLARLAGQIATTAILHKYQRVILGVDDKSSRVYRRDYAI